MAQQPARFRDREDYERFTPVHVVWELTLACNLKCSHCGSRAGRRRPDELTSSEALDVVDQLARLGTRELTIIGGEAYLRRDWTDIVAAASGHAMFVGMQTGARALTERRLQAAAAAGLQGLGVSLDGLPELHDRLRGVRGSFDHGILTLERAKGLGLSTSVNTQIGPETIADLPELLQRVVETGIGQWQVQLTVAMGNAVDNPELILQPYQLLELMPLLADLYREARRHGVLLIPGNNVGYFGPYESLWRTSVNDQPHWSGCGAGQTVIGLEADGTVKGCPSLPTVGYAGGKIRDLSLEQIWASARESEALRPSPELWGFCRSCYYADVCRGGCTWTSHSLLGRAGNNPYCHHRALTLQREGRRERVVKVEEAGPGSFAIGRFDLVEEALDGSPLRDRESAPGDRADSAEIVRVVRVEGREAPRARAALRLCHGCQAYVRDSEVSCPFCHGDLEELEQGHLFEAARRREVIEEVRRLLDGSMGEG